MAPMTCIEDLRQLYLKRVPRMFVDYCESGSWTETTLRRNLEDFARLQLHQRVAVGVEGGTTTTTMLGEKVALPWRWRRSACAACSTPTARCWPRKRRWITACRSRSRP